MALSDNLTHYYKFDEASGNLVDTVGALTGTANGSPGTDTGIIINGRTFNGTTQNFVLGSDPGTVWSGDGSVSWWAYNTRAHNSGADDSHLSSGSVGEFYGLLHYTDNNLYAGWKGISGDDRVILAASAGNWPQTTWTHYCLTWVNGGTTTLYCNASSIGTKGATSVGTVGSASFFVGATWFSGANFSGRLDEMGFWTRELTGGEVSSLYNSGAGLSYDSIIGGGGGSTFRPRRLALLGVGA